MEFHAKGASFLLLLCLTATPVTAAQEKRGGPSGSNRVAGDDPDLQQISNGSRPVTRAEGFAILRVAVDSRHPARSHVDCSHFVRGLYERAGYPYQFAR